METNDPSSRRTLVEALDLAIDHHRAGRLPQAAAIYEHILEIAPDHAETLCYLGSIELQRASFPRAEALLRRSLAANPSQEAVHNSLGEALRAQGNLAAAIASYRESLRLKPDYALAHANLGIALAAAGEAAAAEAAYREALHLSPDSVATLNNLGVLLGVQKRAAEARECFAAALRLKPGCVEAETNLGNLLYDQGQPQEAIAAYRRALANDPDYGPAHFYLGIALRNSGQLADALSALRQAVALMPSDAKAHTNLGALCGRMGMLDEAVAECRAAVGLDPVFSLGHNNLASTLHARGQIEEALPHYRRAVELQPHDGFLRANLVHALNYAPGTEPQEIFDAHVEWARRQADVLTPVARPSLIDRTPERRLRIGYVSPYFREHAISVFTEPIFAAHDHAGFEIICYSDTTSLDATTERLRRHADRWVETAGWSDLALAEQIARDQVDILLDLTGHLEGSRLLVFARKPAPIQMSYIGYQNTTGMQAMDYRLTDDWSDPPGADRYYIEELIRLPRTFFCYQPSRATPEVNALPAATRGHITFGSFNKLAKLTGETLECWGRIMAAVTDSRLLILSDASAEALRRIRAILSRHGVAPERIEFAPKRPRVDYLRLHHDVDIALDSFPFNGHTTVCEALWMGVPVVTRLGQTYVTRFGSSALATLELEEWIARTADEYVQISLGLAGDLPRLSQFRGQLRQRMRESPLLDSQGFARNLEAAYRQAWRRFCDARSG